MLGTISLNDKPGTMLSKTGRKLNFEFSNIANYYGHANFLRNVDGKKKSNSVEVKYPKRLLDSHKEAQEPFKLHKGRDLDKEAKDYNSRAPPMGTYNPKGDIRIKTLKLYSRENPMKDKRDTFMNLKMIADPPANLNKWEKKVVNDDEKENSDFNASRLRTLNKSELNKSSFYNTQIEPSKNKESGKTHTKRLEQKSTINYWDQFKREKKGVGLIDFNRFMPRKSSLKQGYCEFDLKNIDYDMLSNHKKTATDVYFFNKASVFKKTREKFVRKMNFYNVKLDCVRPKIARMIPSFNKEVGRRPLSVGNNGPCQDFYDYKKPGTRMPVIDFDKLPKF